MFQILARKQRNSTFFIRIFENINALTWRTDILFNYFNEMSCI